MKFTASRLSDGNKIFPAEIHIEPAGLTVKIPGLFSGKTEYFDFKQISNVSVNTPMIGYSTITFHAASAKVHAHGFKSSEVKQIKKAIEDGKAAGSGGGDGAATNVTNVINKGDSALTTGVKAYAGMLNKIMDDEDGKADKAKLESKIKELTTLTFSGTADEIANQLNELVSFASTKPEKSVKNAIIEKIDFGIMKLKGLGATSEADYFQGKLDALNKSKWF